MGADDIDARAAARAASIAFPCAAAGLPLAMLTGSVPVEVAAVFAFVTGTVMLHHARGRRIVDALAGAALGAALVSAAGSDEPWQTLLACVFSLSSLAAYLTASRIIRSGEIQGGRIDGVAAL